jgi:pimeloyl-ACP methyl ester carboxylesterase
MEQVVLLPGLMCDERLFRPLIQILKKKYRVHTPVMTQIKSVDEMANFVLSSISGPFHTVGFSMGGIIAMTVAIKDPSRVKTMVLMDTSPYSDSSRKQEARDIQLDAVSDCSELERIVAQELKPNYIYDEKSNQHILDLCMKMALDLGCEVFVNQCLALRNRDSLIDLLSRIECKTLVLCGEYDKLCPVRVHEEMVAQISNSKLSIIPNCGHFPILEEPELSMREIMSFLDMGWSECRV